MTKDCFLALLRQRLSDLPRDEVEERLNFYREMIDDRIEEGLSETQAVAAVGTIDEIADQMDVERSLSTKSKHKRRLKVGEIVLLILGAPIWLSLLVVVFAVLFSLWVSLWAVFVSVSACAVCGVVAGIGFAVNGHELSGLAMIAAGFVCMGLSILFFYIGKAATKGLWLLIGKMVPIRKKGGM